MKLPRPNKKDKEMKIVNLEHLIDKHYEEMFEWLCSPDAYGGDNFFELVVEVKITNEGKTIRRSWRDREAMLKEEE